MGQPLWGRRGGIFGLLELDSDVWEAIEYEAVRGGRSLADLSWREIKVLVRHAEPGSAIFRATFGEEAMWGVTDHLLASLVDLTNILVWFKSKDGQKNKNRPKPVQRPGQKKEGLTFGGGGVALAGEEFEAEWERRVAKMVSDAESAANEETTH